MSDCKGGSGSGNIAEKAGDGDMDKVLKDLKRIREQTEGRFRSLLDDTEKELKRLIASLRELEDADAGAESMLESVGKALAECGGNQLRLIEGLRESVALHNARCAELARQLTVLPFERMDLILDQFERRLEAQETALQRLKQVKKED